MRQINNNQSNDLSNFLRKWKSKIEDNPKITIFLGAGASVPSGISGLKDLLSEFKQDAKKYEVNNLVEYLERTNDIEKALTFLQILEIIEKFDLFDLIYLDDCVRQYRYIHEKLFELFDIWFDRILEAEPNVIHDSIAKFVATYGKNVSIVTTNYNCCMEKALLGENVDIITYTG